MLELSESAKKELESYFEGKDKSTIRIYLAPSCSGARLVLVLDEAGDDDVTEEAGGFTFCINKNLQANVGNIKLDMTDDGFTITPEKPLPQPEGGGCGGCCGGCGSKKEDA